MTIDHSNSSYRDTLKSIVSLARSLKAPSHHISSPAITNFDLQPLRLSVPDGLSPHLLSTLKCSPSSALRLSEAFVCVARQLCTAYENAYMELAPKLISDPDLIPVWLQNVGALFESRYCEQLKTTEKRVIDQVKQQQQQSLTPKKVFNQEFVPLLEKYFEYNAYPSAPDRAVLAKKSMMTARQIEVWFQNHRNRAKKEGKRLKKLTQETILNKLSLKSLERKMPFFMIPEEERSFAPLKPVVQQMPPEQEEDDGWKAKNFCSQDPNAPSTISSKAPPHAYPTKYSSSCNREPFPLTNGTHIFPAPVWMRIPASPRPHNKVPIDMDAFIHEFNIKLELRRPTSRKQAGQGTYPPWYFATQTVVSTAPHPSLVRSQIVMKPTTHTLLPDVPAPAHRCHPFRSPSPSSQPATFTCIQPTNADGFPMRKKIARLPRRTPKGVSLAHRSSSPAISEGSPPPTHSRTSSSRASSFGSNTPTSRALSSSSSLSSSSEPRTPITSLVSLPLCFNPHFTNREHEQSNTSGDVITQVLLQDIPHLVTKNSLVTSEYRIPLPYLCT